MHIEILGKRCVAVKYSIAIIVAKECSCLSTNIDIYVHWPHLRHGDNNIIGEK